jgi:hypothetical protein
MTAAEAKTKDCCPICGHRFDTVGPVNICPTGHRGDGQNGFAPNELIADGGDYAWVL